MVMQLRVYYLMTNHCGDEEDEQTQKEESSIGETKEALSLAGNRTQLRTTIPPGASSNSLVIATPEALPLPKKERPVFRIALWATASSGSEFHEIIGG